jgi:hypothetical protein
VVVVVGVAAVRGFQGVHAKESRTSPTSPTGAWREVAPTLGSMSATAEAPTPARRRVRWFSRRAVLLHLAVIIWFPGCFVAMWWQVTVALGGNALGWLYAIEWPVFAVFGVIGWWQLVHDDEQTVRARRWMVRTSASASASASEVRAAAPAATTATATATAAATEVEPSGPLQPFEPAAIRAIHRAEEEDDELAAYNAYLARLATTGGRKSWRHPTGADR